MLKNIDLHITKGEFVSIIGSSGCGKTTLLRCINCLEILDSGSISIDDTVLEREMPVNKNGIVLPGEQDSKHDKSFRTQAYILRSSVGMVFQSFNLFPHLTVLENISLAPIIVKKINKIQAHENAIKLLKKVGMEKYVDRKPHKLSGGQVQRVAIARALAMNPKVMLYDEPTSALDPALMEEVFQVMKTLHNEGMTQIVVTHAMNFAKKTSDRIVFMEEGEIVEINDPESFFSNPIDERTKKYLNIFNAGQ